MLESERDVIFSSERIKKIKAHLFDRGLSKRETDVVLLVVQGLTNRQVADKLCVAEKTVKFHLTNVYKRLKIQRRSEIIWTMPFMRFLDQEKDNETASPSMSSGTYHASGESQAEELSIPTGSSPISGGGIGGYYSKDNKGGSPPPTTSY